MHKYMMKFIVNGTIGSSTSALNHVEGELEIVPELKKFRQNMEVMIVQDLPSKLKNATFKAVQVL